ncbi:hypothetical protein BDV34DRAFT_233934 [Aspergillus parasiticus]|uniref:Carrier domain-containing protein n=1 Tax=Aspergillus parasiticus TaxID=5067 RepID=A0A5N6E5A5_ASPPA|nr:hypothetical protein BDV34DRAFT_233934 [Aspergillus parasiticus]
MSPSKRNTAKSIPSERAPWTVDELLRFRRYEDPNRTAVIFPTDKPQYAEYTMQQLDSYALSVARQYAKIIPPKQSSADSPCIVAVQGSPDFEYLITLLALSKLGHPALLLSPRLSTEALKHLLSSTKAQLFLAADTESFAKGLAHGIQVARIASFDKSPLDPLEGLDDSNLTPMLDLRAEHNKPVWILHSSGSTGLPRPVPITHRSALWRYSDRLESLGLDTLTTLPLFHAHGMSSFFRAIYARKVILMYNLAVPITTDRLIEITRARKFGLFSSVPFTLKILAESERGVDLLRSFQLVTSGGGPVGQALGDMLVKQGVQLVSIYGSSEAGTLMTSLRRKDDLLWDWLRPLYDGLLRFEPHGGEMLELIVPRDWPARVDANLPDGSWSTKDLFVRHPTIEAYRYAGRIDDVLVMENGEKTNPISVESEITKHAYVEAAVIFGQNRSALGLAVVPSSNASGLHKENILQAIWPSVEAAQQSLPSYASITQEMVVIFEVGTVYPRTDKGTAIRQAFYTQFGEEIASLYQTTPGSEAIHFDSIIDAGKFVSDAVAKVLHLPPQEFVPANADFSDLGMDSLQATQLLDAINREVKLHGNQLELGVIFAKSSVLPLADEVFRRNHHMAEPKISESDESIAKDMIQKYSGNLPYHNPTSSVKLNRSIVLTGATGSLGAHLLSQLATDPSVSRIWCLVRAQSPAMAESRVKESLHERCLFSDFSSEHFEKVVYIPASLPEASLGIDPSTYTQILAEVTDILHCGWPVNFSRNLRSFERDGILGLRNLIDTTLKSKGPVPARIVFFSSIGTAMCTPSPDIPEEVPVQFDYAQTTGYARSKYVAEHICQIACQERGVPTSIVRIGQIIGDTRHGVWNISEATPLMIRSAKTLGCLPALDESLEWLPVDLVAKVTSEILSNTGLQGPSICEVFNVVNPHTLSWKEDLLPILQQKGLQFDIVEPRVWLEKLKQSDPDPMRNPTIKLKDYFTRKIDVADSQAPEVFQHWRSERTKLKSPSFAAARAPEAELLGRILHYFDEKFGLLESC